VLAFAEGDAAREAEAAGADFVGSDDLLARIQGGWTDFDVAIATPDLMGKVGRVARILGPRGLMPNPRSNTVTTDLTRTINEIKGGRVEFRVDRGGVIHVPLGKASFTEAQIVDNLGALIDAVVQAKPAGSKGQYIRGISMASSMSPGIHLELAPTLAPARSGS
jgi:large subunit ribosomal protein L1